MACGDKLAPKVIVWPNGAMLHKSGYYVPGDYNNFGISSEDPDEWTVRKFVNISVCPSSGGGFRSAGQPDNEENQAI